MSTRALIVCPGRGSYGREQLGSLKNRAPAAAAFIDGCDEFRAGLGRPTLTELDGAERFSGRSHVAGEHASLLTAACSVADYLELGEHVDVVGVTGNSMGWYTALGLSGALAMDDTVRLVETMAAYQANNLLGGQIITPIADDDFVPSAALRAAVEQAITACRDAGHQAWWSIDLGSFAVLGADKAGVAFLLKALAPIERGPAKFPRQLPMHSAFHTPLLQPASEQAQQDLAALRFCAPKVPLFDGHGHVWLPHTASPAGLRSYTLGAQVTEPFNFKLAVQTALATVAPDVVVLLGPGNSLGAPTAAILVEAGWFALRSKAALRAADPPRLLAFARPEQRALLA